MSDELIVRPLTPARLEGFARLFGPRGACGGCWCMTPRLSRAEYELGKGEGNRRAMYALVESGAPTGVLGYLGRSRPPIAWCAVAPRADFPMLARSRILKPLDDQPVWSITCLFVEREARRRGLSSRMIDAAARHAFALGAPIVEGYPVEPRQDPMPPVFAYTGIASAYLAAGFAEVARRSETRPIMRRVAAGP